MDVRNMGALIHIWWELKNDSATMQINVKGPQKSKK